MGDPYLYISLAKEDDKDKLFELGHVVMTAGAAELEVDFAPFLARHSQADWGELDSFDKKQNDIAVREGYRILSAYDVPIENEEAERIWIITEADRSATTILLPSEY
ncbi:MAG: type I restriction endonuclease subunit M [Aestuariibacter sp.]|nr:type I restriction endonuclease subunit M [Aestuariibacter sp.]